ncbi:hypothetical protein [Rhizobium lentis]|uniref:hypothetical protein n=2 Tax=Rhizobium lentis TaxID=1138194 RepID=UPI002180B55D|nr:hypothetical protein [Rhizobium lentis]
MRQIRRQRIVANGAYSSIGALKGRCTPERNSVRIRREMCETRGINRQHRRGYITASACHFSNRCESLWQGQRGAVDIGAIVRLDDHALSLSDVTLVERRAAIGTIGKRAILVSIRGLRGCRKLSTIVMPFGRFARLSLSADGQPSGHQRIHQE